MPKVKQISLQIPLEALPTVGTSPTMHEILTALGVNERGRCSRCINPLGRCQVYKEETGWQFCPIFALMRTIGL